MIRVQRGAEPEILRTNKATWTTSLLASTTPKKREKASSKYRHHEVKLALVRCFHGKCAYCESKILHVDYGHIEHYRPKSSPEYQNLAFDWNNLLLACAVCNGPLFKGVKFPEASEGGPLVNPCEEDPSDHLSFVFDIKAKLATVTYKSTRGRVTVELLGLNRENLRTYRSRFIEKLYVISRFAQTDPEARRIIQMAQEDDGEYAAFARNIELP
jgi:uncharacterized protein (TIGR02646 family)